MTIYNITCDLILEVDSTAVKVVPLFIEFMTPVCCTKWKYITIGKINYFIGGSVLPLDEIIPYLGLYLSSESMPLNSFLVISLLSNNVEYTVI